MQNTAARSGATQPHGRQGRGPNTPVEWTRSSAPRRRWSEHSNAPHSNVESQRFRVTHPYHPLYQQEFDLVSYRQNWGEDRVWFQDKKDGHLHSLPMSWTDIGAVDPFVAIAAGGARILAEGLGGKGEEN